MKLVQAVTITAALAFIAGTAALAGEGKGEGPRGGHGPGPMMEHLLPLNVVDDLNLTADQKTKLDELDSAFKTDAEAWKKAHAQNPEEFRKAKEAGDKETLHKLGEDRKQLMETRKGYVDKLRASLTDEQKTKLNKFLEDMRERHGKGPRDQKHED